MTETERTNIAILKWVVNPALPVPEIETLDEEALSNLIQYHRIFGQAIARLDAAKPKFCPPRLLAKLRIRQHHVRTDAKERMVATREITRAMRARSPCTYLRQRLCHVRPDKRSDEPAFQRRPRPVRRELIGVLGRHARDRVFREAQGHA